MPKLKQGILAVLLAALPSVSLAQTPPISENLSVDAAKAWTWQDKQTNVAQFDGPVTIDLDQVHMSADSAVMWVSPAQNTATPMDQVEIALIGNAKLEHGDARRSGDRLFVTALVRNGIRVTAQDRLNRDRSQASVYQAAAAMRDESGMNIRQEPGHWRLPRPTPIIEQPASLPSGQVQRVEYEVHVQAPGELVDYRMPDGTLAFAAEKGIIVTINRHPDQVIQLQAKRAVIFTPLKTISGDLGKIGAVNQAAQSVYLEGDVQVLFSPKSTRRPDVQLEANQVFYEIATDRAVLTHAVMHTMDPGSRIPVVIRAQTMKQLSRNEQLRQAEYRTENSSLTTSSFATPSYAVGADRVYIKQYDSGDEWYGTRTDFSARNTTLDFWGMPVLWLPYAGGSVTERGFPLRSFDIGSSSREGFFTKTEWGLFESIGRTPPRNLDISYHADYLASRGPFGGIDGTYSGQGYNETTGQADSFTGDFKSYFGYDTGTDKFGSDRLDVPYGDPDTPNGPYRKEDFRGRVRWEHQQFLPDDWQAQIRYSWISDPGFLEEYFPDEYRGIEPSDASFYLKHQRDTEAVTFLAEAQPNHFVTTQEYAAEGFEVKRMPEVGYYRTGDSFADDSLTFFSANTLSRLGYDQMGPAQIRQLGYPTDTGRNYVAGIPAEGFTGTTNDYVDRADLRQEIDAPLMVDKIRVMPYVMARYTSYSDTPNFATSKTADRSGGGGENRSMGGAGIRMTTEFWRVDDYAESDLWDIHRVRHVIEPEVNAFTSVADSQPTDLFIFDEPVDNISDISALQLALHQRWQTKRGAPGKWESVDFLTWNIEGDFFFNKPNAIYGTPTDDPNAPVQLANGDPDPRNFRGMYFASAPETSIPRDAINSDETWKISDSTAVLSDQQYSLEADEMATSAIGLAVRRGDRMTYYVGDRYINELDSNIISFLMNYELSTKYSLGFGESYDTNDSSNVDSNFSVIRRFDRFYVAVSVRVDDTTGESGFYVNIRPAGAPSGIAAQNLPAVFNR